MELLMEAIGAVSSSRSEVLDDDWDSENAVISLDPARFTKEALWGLAEFSHAEILFVFDQVPESKIERGARRPRGNTDWPLVGIFAQRGKNRPNRIGSTVVRIESVDGLSMKVSGLDAVDGTPVLDIKPFMAEFGPRGAVIQPRWATELMRGYW
ncbi:SAM-dependent methyltransferase [Arthrobacter zhangbolii]|uniref:SAM-dependent methyltransferase n=1 Tax=Arthrobacter zhangbolii TaxID=2886936 RepID=A0A9X1S8T0_9MICC|nr:SAM-dependent methyltransferase [Arthrobacter zhangbolii]MCC3271796.1 SAM-dependent methyltransferase [Arthrobacter zhangbolii]UON93379.1 SAM-dependent methyltransferase [Arthrobacter zhangbolii]